MGAHTLGEAQTDASGYRGVWIGGQSTDFNNVYHKYLTSYFHKFYLFLPNVYFVFVIFSQFLRSRVTYQILVYVYVNNKSGEQFPLRCNMLDYIFLSSTCFYSILIQP